MHYCLQCGTQLQLKEIENRSREFCPVCGWINYEHLKISAGCRVQREGRLLLVQRRNPPFVGTWHLPSGYVEGDEPPIHAAMRETREECGLIVAAGRLAGAYFYNDDDRGNGVVLFYDAAEKGGSLRNSDETLDARFFSPAELETVSLAGMSAEQSIQDWLKEMQNG